MTRATILSLGQRGEGVAEIDGNRVYVPFSLPGEVVDITIEGDRGHLIAVETASPERVDAFCPHFGICGGCALQHLGPDAYAGFKRGLVETALSHANVSATVNPLVDARGKGRRRATLHARNTGSGYMRARSHDVLDIDTCPILVPALAKAPNVTRAVYNALGDCDVSFTATLTGIDVSIRTEKHANPKKLTPLLAKFDLARMSLNGETVLQARVPVVRMGRSDVDLPLGSFLQATEAAETMLADLVVAPLKGAKSVADLFSGLGPFTLRIAEKAKVFAADSDKPAIEALKKAVNFTQGIKAITAVRRDLFREPLTRYEMDGYDAVVLDPPRAGAEAQCRELAVSKIKTLVSVSCDPKTFARDAAILIAGGYKLESVTPVDQFAWSTHVEVVGVFRR